MSHVLFIGYGLEADRTEAVAKNTIRLQSQMKKRGFRTSVANIGFSSPASAIDGSRSMASAVRERKRILQELITYIQKERVTHLHDVFVLPLASQLFTLPVKKKLPELILIKEVHNFPGFSPVLHLESLIRFFGNRAEQLQQVIEKSDSTFTRNYAISEQYQLPFLPAPIIFDPLLKKRREKKLQVCYLGHPLKKKGIYAFPQIFAELGRLGQRDIEFTIALSKIGDRKGVQQLLADSARDNGLTVRFCNEVVPSQFFRGQDVLLLPLQDEYSATSTPNCILEAMEAGCVVLTTNTRSLRGVIEHGRTGFLLPKFSAVLVIAFLEKLRNNEELVQNTANSARLWIEENYNPQKAELLLGMIYEKDGRGNSKILPERASR